MLVLTRKPGEKVLIGDGINVTVAEVKGNKVRLGFEAPDDVRILRAELTSQPEQRPPIDGLKVGRHHRLAGKNHLDATTVSSATRSLPKTEQAANLKIITFTAGQVR